jgi:hypothetical protein
VANGGQSANICRAVLVALGSVLAVVAVAADSIGLGAPGSGLGASQVFLLIVGLLLSLLALAIPRLVSVRTVVRLLLVCTSGYLAAILGDVVAFAVTPRLRPAEASLQGMFCKDDQTGYRLTPGWHGYFDNGVDRVEYRINSRGHRDNEPSPVVGQRLLLIGDSFAFGYRLDQSDTVDKQIEALTDGEIDAYNIGVQGYGPPAILESLRRCEWLHATDVVYLFFNNDLRDDNLLPDSGLTCFDGFLVPKCKADGSRYTDTEYRRRIRNLTRPAALLSIAVAREIVKLSHLKALLGGVAVPRIRMLDTQGPGEFKDENIDNAYQYTAAMREVASRRGMDFHVVIVPTPGETQERRHAELVKTYIDRLRRDGFHIVDLLGHLPESAYFPPPDIHITAAGAKRAAEVIVKALQ